VLFITPKLFLTFFINSSGSGHSQYTSSVFGLFPVPSQVPYCVSKYAVRGFTETLAHGVEVVQTLPLLACIPGGIKTNIVNFGIHYKDGEKVKAEFDKVALTTAEKGSFTIIIRAVEKKAKRVMVGPDAKLIRFVSQLSPNLLDSFVLKASAKTGCENKCDKRLPLYGCSSNGSMFCRVCIAPCLAPLSLYKMKIFLFRLACSLIY
jgi:short-subunit dehydrogenase